MEFPSIREVERRRIKAGVTIAELCRAAGIAAWSYHRHRNNDGGSPRLATLQSLYTALDKIEREKAA